MTIERSLGQPVMQPRDPAKSTNVGGAPVTPEPEIEIVPPIPDHGELKGLHLPSPDAVWDVAGTAHPGLSVSVTEDYYDICAVAEGGKFGAFIHRLKFQSGPVKEVGGNNGVSVESLLVIALHRLGQHQESEYACDENAQAIRKIQSGLDALDARTAERKSRGVEGTNEK